MKKIYTFVILHYLSLDDTKKCVDSIIKNCFNFSNVNIVIVDNGSHNETGKELKKLYKNYDNIFVLISKQNLGFANGNNIGFRYSKYELKSDYIIMINNDTKIVQKNFLKKIDEEYNFSNFAVLGPKIILKNGNINGIYKELQTIKHYKKDFRIICNEYFLNYIFIYPIYKFFRQNLKNILLKIGLKKLSIKNDPNIRYENIVLHGCALIFSKEYINKFDGLDDRTFLFREEELLYIRLMRNNLKNIYSPELVIYHDEDGATNYLNKNKRKKRIFVGKNMIKSTKILIDELERGK